MRLIYYSTAYYATHGGSNHSKAFVKYSKMNLSVQDVLVFPEEKKSPSTAHADSMAGKSLLGKIYNSKFMLPLKLWRRKNLNLQALYNTIDAYKPDAIVIRMDNNFLQIDEIRKKYPKLIVATEVNASPFDESFKDIYFKGFFQGLERASLAKAHLNFFVTSLLRNKIFGKNYKPDRDFVNQNGYDTDLFFPVENKIALRTEIGFPEAKTIIGYVGTLDVHKKLDLLPKVAAKLAQTHNDFKLVIIGDGPYLETLKTLVAEANVHQYFHFTGRIEHSKVPKYIQAFDIGLHHAAHDYMSPLKLFEYLAVKLPSVAPNTPSVKEIFTDGKHLLLTNPQTEDIYEKLRWLMENPDKANAIAQTGYLEVKNNFTWQHNADRIITQIQKLLRNENNTGNTKATA